MDPNAYAVCATLGRYTPPFTATFPLVTDGRQALPWYVVDVWGNATNVYLYLNADNLGPKLSVTAAPRTGAKVKVTCLAC